MRTRPVRGTVATAMLLATTWGCAVTGSSGSSDEPVPAPSSPAAAAHTTSTGSVSPARRARSVLEAEPPEKATLPSGRRVRISAVGTTSEGLLAVPDDVDVAGWWRGGSRLGDPFGSILVAAHVDSRAQGLGPFAELLTADRGARVRLASAGLEQTFEIRSRRLVAQGSLTDDAWIFAATGTARLTLVTCAPPYDASRGGYQNLAVVTAAPLGPPEES
ncbi:class F sortase [Nocardioides sp.]|uniref:class F sortase n=1 Tax=Nocardioides sp. TaxID=35761 RepID=UPI0035AEE1AF